MKSYNEWAGTLNEFHPSTGAVNAFQGSKISADPQVVSMLKPIMTRVQRLYPDNKEAYQQVLAAVEHLMLGVGRYATASQIAKAIGQEEESL